MRQSQMSSHRSLIHFLVLNHIHLSQTLAKYIFLNQMTVLVTEISVNEIRVNAHPVYPALC